jgi:hypothetical protein
MCWSVWTLSLETNIARGSFVRPSLVRSSAASEHGAGKNLHPGEAFSPKHEHRHERKPVAVCPSGEVVGRCEDRNNTLRLTQRSLAQSTQQWGRGMKWSELGRREDHRREEYPKRLGQMAGQLGDTRLNPRERSVDVRNCVSRMVTRSFTSLILPIRPRDGCAEPQAR